MEVVALVTAVGACLGLWYTLVSRRDAKRKGKQFGATDAARSFASGVAAGWWLFACAVALFLLVFALLNV